MAGIINTGSFSKLLWPGLNSIFGETYTQYPREYDLIFDKSTSQKAYEEELGVSMFGLAKVKPQGAPIEYDSAQQGFLYRYTHIVYGLGFTITREMREDNQYMEIGLRNAKALAWSMNETKEQVAAGIMNTAFNVGGNPTYGDGQTMISNSHPNVAGGTQSNQPLVNADLSEAALEQAVIDISLLTDDRGKLIALRPKKLIIPPQLQFEAKRVLGSDLRPGTPNNDLNALKTMGHFQDGVELIHRLSSNSAWFIKTDAPDGLKYFERRAPEFEEDNEFDTENARFKATERYSFGITDWRGVYASPGV
jgi:hypothetical protein